MTRYELLTILFASIGAALALAVWSVQRRMQREAYDLQRAAAELTKKQLEMQLREEEGKQMARVALTLVRDGKAFKFNVINLSDVDAQDVEIGFMLVDDSDNPLVMSEYNTKFPAKCLGPGSTISLTAALHLGRPMAFNVRTRWVNPDGSRSEEITYIAL